MAGTYGDIDSIIEAIKLKFLNGETLISFKREI